MEGVGRLWSVWKYCRVSGGCGGGCLEGVGRLSEGFLKDVGRLSGRCRKAVCRFGRLYGVCGNVIYKMWERYLEDMGDCLMGVGRLSAGCGGCCLEGLKSCLEDWESCLQDVRRLSGEYGRQSDGCGEVVWRMWRGCQKNVLRLTEGCGEVVWRMWGGCL